MTRWTQAMIVAILLTGAASGEDNKDLANLQGAWKAAKAVRDGAEAPGNLREALRVVVAGNKLTILADTKTTAEAEITLNPSATPATIDLKPVDQKDSPLLKGIYRLDGETLRLCWAREGGPRPTEFGSKAEAKTVLFELKREKK